MDPKFIEELRQKYIKNPPEGMTAKLVKKKYSSCLYARLQRAILIQASSSRKNFL